jgi:hypothetical protein
MPVYRDDRDALRLRVEALRREVEGCEGRVTEAFWRCIPDDDAEALRALRTLGDAHTARGDAPSLSSGAEAFERYLRRFERVFGELDAHEAAWRAIPEAEVLRTHRYRTSNASQHAMTREFARVARILDVDARLEVHVGESDYDHTHSARAELHVEGQPVILQLTGWGITDDNSGVRELRASTTVPRGIPAFVVRPETWVESLFRGLRMRRHEGLGDARFDTYFHVECEPDALSLALTAEVRTALVVIAAVDVPTLTVKPPTAALTWRFAPTEAALIAAARCVAAVRRAKVLPILKR